MKKFVLGTVQLGLPYGIANQAGMPTQEEALKILQAAYNAGVQVFDTARAYGESENRIGKFLKSNQSRLQEQKPRIVTKLDPQIDLPLNSKGESAHSIRFRVRESINQSLQALGLSQLSTLLLHNVEHHQKGTSPIWKECLKLRDSGMIGSLGASVYTPEQACELLKDQDVQHIQLPYSAADDQRWQKVFIQRAVLRPDVVLHARSVFLQGVLLSQSSLAQISNESIAKYWIMSLQNLANELGRLNTADLLLAFARGQNEIDGIVLGLESIEQLQQNIEYFNRPALSVEERLRVRQVMSEFPQDLLNPSQWKKKAV